MMPFRIPKGYAALSVCEVDPLDADLEKYIDWLKTELETAQAVQESRGHREEDKADA